MALLGNRFVLNAQLGQAVSGVGVSGDRRNANKSGSMKNWGLNSALDWSLSAVPYGYYAGGAVMLPRVAGAMVSRRQAHARSSSTAAAAAGLPGTAAASAQSSQALEGFLRANMSGSAAAASSQLGELIGILAGTAEAFATSSQTGLCIALVSITGDGFAQSSQTALGSLAITGTGSASAQAGQAGALTGVLYGDGLASAIAASTADMIAVRNGTGTAFAVSLAEGDLVAYGLMTAAAAAQASASGSMYAIGYMTGSTIDDTILTVDAVVNGVIAGLAEAGTGLTPEQATQLRELWRKEGLDATKLVTHTPSSIKVGDPLAPDFEIALTGNRKTLTTMERQ